MIAFRLLLPFFLFFNCLSVIGQNQSETTVSIPKEKTNSIPAFSEYIRNTFTTPEQKLEAIYQWITHNISYDISMMNQDPSTSNAAELAAQTLKSRKGVCMHYASLFQTLAMQSGVSVYCINGYTRQDGQIKADGHQWCIAELNKEWYFFDPTWDAGYIKDGKIFVPRPATRYYRKNAGELIKDHMPFDPMWQFLPQPLSYPDFDKGEIPSEATSTCVKWADTLQIYLRQDSLQQYLSTFRRMTNNGNYNPTVKQELQILQQNITVSADNHAITLFNRSQQSFNKGVEQLNRFINYRNNRFKPALEEIAVRKMVDDAEESFKKSASELQGVLSSHPEVLQRTAQLRQQQETALNETNTQKAFIDKYYSTKKILRGSLFQKYTWFGIPLN